MSSSAISSSSRQSSTKTPGSTIENAHEYYVDNKGVKILLPETSIPTVAIKVPELKNETSLWQIGTISMTRVKINALRPEVKIRTEEAGEIEGMFSELYQKIPTLGTVIVHIADLPIKVHVTRSKQTAPIVSDGVLGYDFLAISSCTATFSKISSKLAIRDLSWTVPILQGKDFIPDYLTLIRRRMIESSVAHERGPWSVVSKELMKLRDYLPPRVIEDNRLAVIEILEEFADCFYLPGEKLGFTELLKYRIRTKTDDAISLPRNNLSRENWEEIDRQVTDLLDQGIICESKSPYNAPMTLIEKKPDFKGNVRYRLAADFHELNKHSLGDAFHIPDIIDLVDRLHGSKYFSVLDLASASYQIELYENDRPKTAFSTRNGHYEFQRMPLGIKNASQNIQRMLHQVFDELLYPPSPVFVCHDDIIINASTIEEHEVRVRKVLSRIRNAGLKLQPSKCQLFQSSVLYLGYLVTDEGLRPDPVKIKKIQSQQLPKTRHCLSTFLGLTSSFKRFVPNYAGRAKTMASLMKNNNNDSTPLDWTSEAKESFEDVKRALSGKLLLRYPDWNEAFILETSSSEFAIQAALLQKTKSGNPQPIAYTSRCYSPAEIKYNKQDRVRLAAMFGMETWYWYLTEKKFILRTPQPRAFDWYVKRRFHNSEILGRFEMAYSDKEFAIELLE